MLPDEYTEARARRARRKRVLASGLAALATLDSGCYTYRANTSAMAAPGLHVALDISDQGRVGLADQLGPGVTRIEGLITSADSQAYVISVAEISTIGGGSAHWTGEHVSVRPQFVSGIETREFSRSRTMLTIGAAVAAIGLFIVTRSLVAGGYSPGSSDTGGGQGS